MTEYELFGPVDSLLGSAVTSEILVIELVLLVLVLANMGARAWAHRRHVSQVERARDADGTATDDEDLEPDEALSRSPLHLATNLLLVLGALYYVTLAHHAGMVLSVLVIGVVLTDVFEFESRKVEARRELPLDRPKAAVLGSVLALVYLGYVTLFTGPIGQFA